MRTRTVAAPGGPEWRVRLEWLPRWRFLARRFGGWRRRRRGGSQGSGDLGSFDLPNGGGGGGGGGDFFSSLADDIAVAIAVIIAFIVFAAVFWFVLLPLLLLVLDVLAVLVLCLVAAAGRVLLRRPWTVAGETVAGGTVAGGTVAGGTVVDGALGRRFVVDVVGWRAARRTRDEIAERLRIGYPVAGVVAEVGGRWVGPSLRSASHSD